MRILYDIISIQMEYERGIGRYSLRVLRELLKYPDVEIVLLYSEYWPLRDLNLHGDIQYISATSFPKDFDGRFDFLFVTNFFNRPVNEWGNAEIVSRCSNIVGILYDLIPLLFGGHYFNADISNSSGYVLALESVRLANNLFSISKSTRDDAVEILGIPSKDISVVYGGIPDVEERIEANAETSKYHVVCISGDDVRKNYLRTAMAFCKAYSSNKIDQRAKLFIVCHMTENSRETVYDELEKHGYGTEARRVIFTGFLPDEILKKLLSSARLSIFVSLYEGLGLPILESYLAGCPCVGSNVSSLKEITAPECQADPCDVEDISRKIAALYNDRALRRASVEFGGELLKKVGCARAVGIMHKKMLELLSRPASSRTAVFTTMPPAESGIALYSADTFAQEKDKWDIFTEIHSLTQYESVYAKNRNSGLKIYPANDFPFINILENYESAIFVIGNSDHNLSALEGAISSKYIPNRYLHLHETDLAGLWEPYCKKHGLFLEVLYDKFYKSEGPRLGILPLISLSGIKNVIVNNERAKKHVLEDIDGKYDVNITSAFLPIKKSAAPKNFSYVSPGIYIGSFGIPHEIKNTHLVIDAVKYLNELYSVHLGENSPWGKAPFFRLVLGGYGVNYFLNENNLLDADFIIGFDAPDDQFFLSGLDSVDILVQLRKREHGESSGTINQAIGMGKTCLISSKFTEYKNFNSCHFVDDDIDPKSLALKILLILAALPIKKKSMGKSPDSQSLQALSKLLGALCGSDEKIVE